MQGPDEAAVDRMLARLLALGVAEEREDGVRTSRSWNLALQRASDKLNRAAAERRPEGNPLALAVDEAMTAEALPFEGAERDLARHVLVLLELVNMPHEKRVQLGWGGVRLPE